jgi:hypothetical protein
MVVSRPVEVRIDGLAMNGDTNDPRARRLRSELEEALARLLERDGVPVPTAGHTEPIAVSGADADGRQLAAAIHSALQESAR